MPKNNILTPFHHKLIKLRVWECLTMEEIAERVRLKRDSVQYHFRNIHRILGTSSCPEKIFPQYRAYIGSDKILIELGLAPSSVPIKSITPPPCRAE